MLTGDENIVDIQFTVFWLISDAGKFLFNIASPEATVKAAAESAMREVVGNTRWRSSPWPRAARRSRPRRHRAAAADPRRIRRRRADHAAPAAQRRAAAAGHRRVPRRAARAGRPRARAQRGRGLPQRHRAARARRSAAPDPGSRGLPPAGRGPAQGEAIALRRRLQRLQAGARTSPSSGSISRRWRRSCAARTRSSSTRRCRAGRAWSRSCRCNELGRGRRNRAVRRRRRPASRRSGATR